MSSVNPHINLDLGLAAKLKQARGDASLSQVELAERLGVSERTLQGWEAGTIPQPRHRRKVLAFIETTDKAAA